MTNYSFKEIIGYFEEKLHQQAPLEDVEEGEVEMQIDRRIVVLKAGQTPGSLQMEVPMGLIVYPLDEEHLRSLMTCHYLGSQTGGCAFESDEAGTSLRLRFNTTPGTTPEENWDWLHRIITVAHEWNSKLSAWKQFVPLSTPKREVNDAD